MLPVAFRVSEAVAVLGTLSGIAYSLICLWAAIKFLRERATGAAPQPWWPPVSILKPLKGTDPEMYESFRSHCRQHYPHYELIFSVSDNQDPAIRLVERLQREFPLLEIRCLVCSERLGPNMKMSNLAQMLKVARYPYLVVNDSDIRVPATYLETVIGPLLDPQVGMTTCLYRGVVASTLGSRLEALGISTDFASGVLAARQLEGGLRFALGSTLALRRQELEAMGGFEALLDYLADDYQLGARVAESGLGVRLVPMVVETFLPPYTWTGFLRHQLRWARAIRDSRPWGYFGLVLTFVLAWSILPLILTLGAVWAWTLFSMAAIVRLTVAAVIARGVLEDRQALGLLWLVPLRDCIALAVWLVSYAGNTVHWRGEDFYLKQGKLRRAGGAGSERSGPGEANRGREEGERALE